MYPDNFRYTKEHEWVRVEGDNCVVGITHHAQKELGDIVYVDLPKLGAAVEAGKTLGSVESVKAVSDIFAPVSGEVIEVNGILTTAPETMNDERPFCSGPSTVKLEESKPIPPVVSIRFLLPSRIVMSKMELSRPPNWAGKPPFMSKTLFNALTLNVLKRPKRWFGL